MNAIKNFRIGQRVKIPFAGEKNHYQWLKSKNDSRFELFISGEIVAVRNNDTPYNNSSLVAVAAWKDEDFQGKILPTSINAVNEETVNLLSGSTKSLSTLKKNGYSLYYPINSYEEVYPDASISLNKSIIFGSVLSSAFFFVGSSSKPLINKIVNESI
jgi:hypothetical protein